MKGPGWRAASYTGGLILCIVVVLAIFGLPIGQSLRLIFDGAFGDRFAISRTVVRAVPLTLTGLGVLLAWRAGMYNIGGEGQFLMGGLFGATVYKLFPTWPALLLAPVILAACSAGGALYGWIAGWLYTKRGVEVVISTILLNFVALQLVAWAVEGPLQEAKHELPQSDQVRAAVMLWKPDRQTDFHSGIFLALIAVGLIWFFLERTRAGFELKIVGASARVARANRINVRRTQERAMLLSGCLCGLAGGVELLGTAGQISTSFSQQWGFLAIPVALVAGLDPLFLVASAIYFGALFAGSEQLGRFTKAGPTLVYVIQAVAVLALVAVQTISSRQVLRREEI